MLFRTRHAVTLPGQRPGPTPHEGQACDDGLVCTVDDTCQSGKSTIPSAASAVVEEELRNALTEMEETGESAPVDVWRREFATATGHEAAAAIARVLVDRIA